MKRSIRTLLLVILISNIFTFSSSASMLGNFYITASGGVLQPTVKLLLENIKNYKDFKDKTGYIGFLGFGYSLIENFRFDGTIFLAKQNYEKISTNQYEKKLSPKIWGGLLTAYGSFKVNSFFEIFAGPSIGYSNIGGKIEYKDIVTNISNLNTANLKRKNNLVLGFSSGIGLILFDTWTVDLSHRYINFGKTSSNTKDNKDLIIEDKDHPIKAHMILLGIRKSL